MYEKLFVEWHILYCVSFCFFFCIFYKTIKTRKHAVVGFEALGVIYKRIAYLPLYLRIFSIVLVLRLSVWKSRSISIPPAKARLIFLALDHAVADKEIRFGRDYPYAAKRINTCTASYTYLRKGEKKTHPVYEPILLVSNEDLFFDHWRGTSGIRNQWISSREDFLVGIYYYTYRRGGE